MKKSILIAVVSLLLLAFGATMVSAGPNPGGMGKMHPGFGQQDNLTEAQKAEMAPLLTKMNDLHLQMVEVHKEMIQKQVAFGNMTQEQADQHLARMQEHMKNGAGPGMMGRGHGMKHDCPRDQQQPPTIK